MRIFRIFNDVFGYPHARLPAGGQQEISSPETQLQPDLAGRAVALSTPPSPRLLGAAQGTQGLTARMSVEHGVCSPTIRTAVKSAGVLQVPPSEIMARVEALLAEIPQAQKKSFG